MENNWGAKCLKMSWGATLFLLLAAIPVVAQLPTATIMGTVKDSSGASVPGAAITIKNMDTGFTRTVSTASDGAFNVPGLATGHYQVQASHEGFKTETHTGITLEVTQQVVIPFTLEVGTTQQQITVTGEAPIVNTEDATLGGLVNETAIKDLPLNGRNYIDLSLLQAGVTRDINIGDSNNGGGGGFGTTFSVNGAPDRSNNFTLDGAILQNQFGRNPSTEGDTTLGVEGIKEYKVITTNFAAEYGVTMGSQMVMVSSSGTNAFHGDVFYFMRNAALDAKNYFDETSKPEFQRNNYGGSLGGPIKKDKTFFFGVYEGLRQNLGVTNLLNVPSPGCHQPAGTVVTVAQCPDIAPTASVMIQPVIAPFLALYPQGNLPSPGPGLPPQFTFPSTSTAHENYGQMRVDHNLSSSDTFFGRYTIDNDLLNNAPQNGFPNFRSGTTQRNQYITLSENHIFTPSVLNTARFSFSRTKFSSSPILQDLPNNDLGPPIIPGRAVGEISILTENFPNMGVENETTTYGAQNIYTLSDDVTITHGKHAFKFGTLLNRWNEGTQSDNGFNGMLRYGSFAQFLASTPNLVEYEPLTANENRDYIYDTLGFYGQDDWRMTSRLTWNLGLRYEFMTTPFEMTGHSSRLLNVLTDPFTIGPTLQNNSLHDFSPRIGVAWDVFGNGKTAVRSGFGIYYDIGNIGTTLKQDSIGNPPFAALADIFSAGTNFVQVPLTPGILSAQSDLTPQFVDYHSKSPYLIQYNMSIQQQLPWGMALGVAYVGTRGVHIFTIKDSNPFNVTSTGPCGDPASLCVNGAVQFWDTGSPKYVYGNPNMPSTIEITTAADSHYNGLQTVLNKRVGHGLEFQSAYTYSKVTDDTQGQANFADCQSSIGLQGVDPRHPAVDRGPACFDSRHNWQFNMLYHLPSITAGKGFAAKAANGWWISSIVSVQSGYPYSAIVALNRSNSGVLQGQSDRVNVNTPALIAKYFNPSVCTSQPGQQPAGANPCAYTPIPFNKNTVTLGTVGEWFNPAMFSIAPEFVSPEGGGNFVGQLGTSGRNIVYGPASRNWNFSLVKDTKVGFLGEAGSIQFRAEFFNVLNHPNFLFQNFVPFLGAPSDLGPFSEAPSQASSQITQTLPNNQREIQFALKILF
jgi:hypothetical protein